MWEEAFCDEKKNLWEIKYKQSAKKEQEKKKAAIRGTSEKVRTTELKQ